MSANRSTPPAELSSSMSPEAPTGTTARFGTGAEEFTFNVETTGWLTPAGHTVTVVGCEAFTAVTFNTTAVASAGTPATPTTCTSKDAACTTFAFGTPNAPEQIPAPVRVSNTRHGLTAK